MKCIYCPNDASESKRQYHVAPHAAGNTVKQRRIAVLGEIVLPGGLACDGCNQYLGEKIEPGLANHPCIQQWRAVYGIASRKGRPSYIDAAVAIGTTASELLVLSGNAVKLNQDGSFQVPQPALSRVDHLQVSRAVHKIALESELLAILKKSDIDTARRAAGEPPLSIIADYIRRGHPRKYRPYGLQPQGGTGVSAATFEFEPDPKGVLISPPRFTGYIVVLPGGRFSCTLAEDASLLQFMIDRIERMAGFEYLTTRHLYWSLNSGGVTLSYTNG
jgi:hypothetical protein